MTGPPLLVCEKAANATNTETKTTKEKEGTKRPADKRPEKALRASPRNPKHPWGQETPPQKKPEGRTAETGGKRNGKGDKNKKKTDQKKRSKGGV